MRDNSIFLKENFEFYVENSYYSYKTFQEQLRIVKEKLIEQNCIILTVEERNIGKLERISFPISYVDDEFIGDGYKFYNSDGEEVFRYYHKRDLGFYYDSSQVIEYHFIKQNSVDFDEEWLKWVVDYAYEDYFNKAQNWFGTGEDLRWFCDKLYMSRGSRLKLEEFVLRRKMKNFEENNGYENSLLKEKLEELLS